MELTDLKVKGLKAKAKTYLVRDGDGLNLMVHPSGKMSWVYRYRVNGNPGKMHLGRYPDVSLKRAREKRNEQRSLVNGDGKSPAQEKKLAKVALAASTTVQEFGEKFFAEQIEPRWKNRQGAINFRHYLNNDIYPRLGTMPVKDVSPVDIQDVVFAKRDRGAHGKKAPPRSSDAQPVEADFRLRRSQADQAVQPGTQFAGEVCGQAGGTDAVSVAGGDPSIPSATLRERRGPLPEAGVPRHPDHPGAQKRIAARQVGARGLRKG